MSKKGYTIIDNDIFQDSRLTLKAKGLYCSLKALPDTWNYNKAGLLLFTSDGIRALNSGLEELKKYGYLDITRVRNPNGQIAYKYILKKPPLPP